MSTIQAHAASYNACIIYLSKTTSSKLYKVKDGLYKLDKSFYRM